MRLIPASFAALVAAFAVSGLVCAAADTFTDPAKAGPDFAVQGEYAGTLKRDGEGDDLPIGVQVIALGDGMFDLELYEGGLPGAGWKHAAGVSPEKLSGKLENGTFNVSDSKVVVKHADGKLMFTTTRGVDVGTLKKVERKSPTLGMKPPEGAVVLFDGSNTDQWHNAKMTPDKLLMVGTMSKPEFQDYKLHLEFILPFMPEARGQGRGNSGVYQQHRYEVQVLDSFGLKGEDNECGGVYTLRKPDVNMCLPPLTWQTYDIDFTGARFDDNKQKTKNARMTMKHNGVVIHDNVELPKLCPGGASEEYPGKGPFYLQDHGNPVYYRNVWVEKK